MQLQALAVILGATAVLGVVLCAPLLWWSRRRRRQGRRLAPGGLGRKLPPAEIGWGALLVTLMFAGFAQAYVAPTTWFGGQMNTGAGRGVFGALLVVGVVALRVGWSLLRLQVLRVRSARLARRLRD